MTVLYKLRDTFTFKVGGGLTIRNLIFDGIDSSIDFIDDLNTSCLQNGMDNCCKLNSNFMLDGPSMCQQKNRM